MGDFPANVLTTVFIKGTKNFFITAASIGFVPLGLMIHLALTDPYSSACANPA